MKAIDNRWRRDFFLVRRNCYRHAMLVGAANEEDFFSGETFVAGVKIGRQIAPGQMTDVQRPISIRPRGGDECAVKFWHLLLVFRFRFPSNKCIGGKLYAI